MDLEMLNQEIASTFSTYETSIENRIRYISGMQHFTEYLYNHNIELQNVGEEEINQYAEYLMISGYPDIFINTNIAAVKKYFSYPKSRDYTSEQDNFIG